MRFLKYCLALCLATLSFSGFRSYAQANVIENQSVYIYTDTINGSDSNPGTVTLPFKTIQAAINLANKYNRADVGTKVIVNPGTYREYVNIAGYSITPAVLTVQAATPGTVVIAGSNVLTNWTQQTPTIYSTQWTANLGYCPIPSGWPTNFAPIAQRAEMVFVNGTPLTEIMSYADLVPGTFYVDDATSTMYVSPAPSTNMATAVVEAAVRPQTLTVSNRTNLVLRGLTMEHGANCMNSSAASVSNSTNVLVDSVQSEWNNWGGFGLFMSTDVTVQNSIASYNGGVGFMGNQDFNSLFNFNESDFNNWRGAQAAFYDWGMGGIKLFAMHGATLQNHYSYNNQAQGLWFDTDNKNITINSSTVSGSLLAALQNERNEGPTKLENSYLCSSNAGVNILTSANFTMQNNVLYNNGAAGRTDEAQIFVAGQGGGINVTDWQTGQVYDLFTTNTTLIGNTVVDVVSGQILTGTYLDASDWSQFTSTVTASDNTYFDPNTASAFRTVNGKLLNLKTWQSNIDSDFTSTWTAPASSPAAACAAPAPAYADFNMNADNLTYAMVSGKVISTIRVNSFGFGAVNLSVEGVPSGVNASISQQSLVSGASTITFTSSLAAVAQNVPITVWATSGSRVHSVTFNLKVVPFATPQTTPKIAWTVPAATSYGTPLSAAQLNATLSVAGTCTYSPAAGTVLSAGTQTLTATCTPTDTVDYSTPAPATVALTVGQVPLTVTASSPSVVYGAAVPAVTPSFAGFVNNETSAALTTMPTCTTSYTTTSAAGSSPTASCSGAVDRNYTISYVPGTVTISQASQAINFTQPVSTVTYGAAPIGLFATASSGAAVTLTGTTGICNVSGSNLSIVAAGSCTVTASQAGNGNYSAATAVSRYITVNPASLAITASSPAVVYGAAVPAIAPSFSGFVNGDSSASLTAQPRCSTTYTTVSAAGSNPATSCSGAVGANYSITYIPGAVAINAAPQSITFAQPAANLTYGAAPISLSATATSGAPVSFLGTSGNCNVSGNTLSILGAGSCTVTATQSGNGNYTAAAAVTRTISVTPAPLTITASSATVLYGAAAPAVTPSFSGFVNGDSSASLTSQPLCATSYTTTSGAGSNPATNCSGAVAANYSISYVVGSVTITEAPQTISFSQPRASSSYGDQPYGLTASSTSGAAVTLTGTAGICNVSGSTMNIVGAGSCTITATQAGTANYSAAPTVTRNLYINPANLTITASSPTVVFGAAVPTVSPSYSGFVNGDTSAALSSQATCSTDYTIASGAGTTPATYCSGANNTNYSISYVAGAVTISDAPQTINFATPAASVTYGSSPITLSATASSGAAVTLTGTAGVCTVSGTTLNFVSAGSCTVTATQAGNSNYTAAAAISHSITVSPASLTITASSAAVVYGASTPAVTPSFSGFVNGDSSASLSTQPICNTSYTSASGAGSNPATTCSGASNPNYAIVYVPGAVSVSQAALTITASSATVTYGAAVPVIVPSYSGFINGQSIASLTAQPICATAYTPTTPAGTYASASCAGAVDPNYAISYVAGAVTINPAPITAAPVLTQAGALGAASESVVISDSTPAAAIFYTTDGSTPTTNSNVYSGPIPLPSTMTVNAIALAAGSTPSAIVTGTYTIQPLPINFANGFTAGSGMQMNGSTGLAGNAIQLTSGRANQSGSAFYGTPVNVSSFTSSFTFQQTNATADGMMFVIQNASTGAKSLGPSGSGLGYSEGPTQAGAILHSVAIKFDLYDNSGEGPNSTGLYTNGAHPTLPSIDLTNSGVNLHSGDPMNVLLQYDGVTLTMTITDTVTSKSYVNSWTLNIPSIVGSSTAYVGFTAASGGSTAVQQVQNWVF